jgi:hypothetical protein
MIADLIPGLEPMADIDRTARRVSHRRPRLDTPRFPTDSGKARFHAVELPAFAAVRTAGAVDDCAI